MSTAPAHVMSNADAPPTSPLDDPAVRLLLQFFHERDVACPCCGYNLRNLTQPTCPECMENLSLKVGVTRLNIAPLLVTLAPGAFCLVASGIFLVMCILFGGPGLRDIGPWLVFAFLAMSGIAAVVLSIFHRRFMRLSRGAQGTFAVITWAVHILVFLLSITMV